MQTFQIPTTGNTNWEAVNRLLQELFPHGIGQPWNMSVQVYTASDRITVAKGCFAFMFTNVGDTAAEVNGMVVFPSATPLTALGDSRAVAAHVNDIYKGRITLKIDAPVNANPRIEIVQLYYTAYEK
jgi:hypothetical protein